MVEGIRIGTLVRNRALKNVSSFVIRPTSSSIVNCMYKKEEKIEIKELQFDYTQQDIQMLPLILHGQCPKVTNPLCLRHQKNERDSLQSKKENVPSEISS